MPYKVDEVHAIAEKIWNSILEDSAEALGSSYKGKMRHIWNHRFIVF
jgi:dTDP-4-amino-4,6-dideoxygalactose transaminase